MAVTFLVGYELRVRIAPGADRSTDPDTWPWVDVTNDVSLANGDGIDIESGRGDEASKVDPGKCTIVFRNAQDYVRTNPLGRFYPDLTKNTPLRVEVRPTAGTWQDVHFGEVPQWAPRWDKSGRDATVSITSAGILRRLNQGEAPPRSALTRLVIESGPPAYYWPLSDGELATQAGSGVIGGAPLRVVTAPRFAGVAGPPGDPVAYPELQLSTTSYAQLASGPLREMPADGWAVDCWFKAASTTDQDNATLWTAWANGTYGARYIACTISTVFGTDWHFVGITASHTGSSTTSTSYFAAGPTLFDGAWHHVRAVFAQDGADVDGSLYVDGVLQGTSTATGRTLGSATQLTVGYQAGLEHDGFATVSVAHLAVYATTAPPVTAADVYTAGAGYPGEAASDRIERLCTGEGIPIVVTAGDSEPLGPQTNDAFLTLLRQAETADGGVLYEAADGLGWQPRAARYNAAVALALDFDSGHVADPPEPVDDDQRVRNDVTVTRLGGSTARYVASGAYDPTGPVGRYDDSVTINVATDDVVPAHAQWRVNMGIQDDLRWPRLAINLAGKPSLITSWLACQIGSRITVAHPPDQVPPDAIDVYLEGWTQRLGWREWSAALDCSPARPWQVWVVEGTANTGRLDTGGSELMSARAAGDTSFAVHSSALPKWSTAAVPYDLEVGGERVTATAVTNVTAAFVAAGTAAHGASGASVTPGLPAGLQGGDLLLMIAAARSSGSTTPNTPSGWERLVDTGTLALFGKYAAGSPGSASTETAPTVTFANPQPSEDSSAQVAAFRGVGLTLHDSATQPNGSAQNIATPALAVTRSNCLIIYAGWKQDDWTSVASPGSAEIGEPDTTTGLDQGIVWSYTLQTTAADVAAATFTVTGGASAISDSLVAALASDVQTMTVTRAVNGISKAQDAGTAVSLWRPSVIAL